MKLTITIHEVNILFDILDNNKDGSISLEEFLLLEKHIVQDRMHISKIVLILGRVFDETFKDIKNAFNFFDINKDGIVSKNEFS